MQDIDKECVVLEEVINLQSAAVTDPKVRKKFVVVGCEEADGMEITDTPNNKHVFVLCEDNLLI